MDSDDDSQGGLNGICNYCTLLFTKSRARHNIKVQSVVMPGTLPYTYALRFIISSTIVSGGYFFANQYLQNYVLYGGHFFINNIVMFLSLLTRCLNLSDPSNFELPEK